MDINCNLDLQISSIRDIYITPIQSRVNKKIDLIIPLEFAIRGGRHSGTI